MTQDDILFELKDLDTRFETLEPELCETVHDAETGIEGYIVVWNTEISVGGPLERMGKGGTRVTPATDIAEIKMLARIMALKNAAAGLPMGGAKSGLKADSSAEGFEAKYRKFVNLCKPFLHENGGIFGGFGFDIGAKPQMPYWACDELGSYKSFTGKPLDMGGTDYDTEGLAGLGVATAAKTALTHDNQSVTGATFSVQGLGAMGAAVVKYFSQHGGVLKSISDPRVGGSWNFDEHGASQNLIESISHGDFDATKAHLKNSNAIQTDGYDAPLFADVDVMFPCAVQDVIHIDNVPSIKARYVSEGANNPTSNAARTWMHNHNITVIPDFIANAGGIIAAYVELTSDVTPEENVKTRANPERAKSLTIERITANTKKLMSLVRDHKIEPAEAGRYMALKNIFKS